MGISENWREYRKYKPWEWSMASYGWKMVGGLVLIAVLSGVLILGFAVVGGENASTGAAITATLVAITAAVIASYSVLPLKDQLPPARRHRAGRAAFWAAILALVGYFLVLAFR
jgi:hypothetical protein